MLLASSPLWASHHRVRIEPAGVARAGDSGRFGLPDVSQDTPRPFERMFDSRPKLPIHRHGPLASWSPGGPISFGIGFYRSGRALTSDNPDMAPPRMKKRPGIGVTFHF